VVDSLEKGEKAFANHERRIALIETEISPLKEMRADVKRGMRTGVAMMAAGILSLAGGNFVDKFIPRQYVQTLVTSPNPVPPAAHPQ
jgi:hypothetical protein